MELGDGYTVEAANRKNDGGTYDTAVVVTKNNESAAKGNTSELGQPTARPWLMSVQIYGIILNGQSV